MAKNRWLLPEGIDEVMPPQAAQVEDLCRQILDLFATWGYKLVMPPLIEYLDSLLVGTGEDLDLQTFKVTDQLSGKMLGIRADMTPQVARIEVHNLKREVPSRLCYLGSVLHTRSISHGGTRMPLQVGAELYGHAGVESDAEILSLMFKTLQICGMQNIHVDLGHAGIYRGLIKSLPLNAEQEAILFDTLQRKAAAELKAEIDAWSLPNDKADMLFALMEMHGDFSILAEAKKILAKAGEEVMACIVELEKISELTLAQSKHAPLYFDLAELRGYHYHTGMMFAAYVPGRGQGIAFGGRYDNIGQAFGRLRPATGFSTDIKTLFNLAPPKNQRPLGIFAPVSEVPGLDEFIASLREEGNIVIRQLPGQSGGGKDMGCDREIVLEGGVWKVRQL